MLPSEIEDHYSVKLSVTGKGAIEFNSTTSIWISKHDDTYTMSPQKLHAQMDRPFYSSNAVGKYFNI